MATSTTTIAKGKRLTGEEREKFVADLGKRYEAGASIAQLAEETGRSNGAVQRMVHESGVTVRPRGGNNRKTA